MIYFTSDTHFGHANILEYEPKRIALGDTIEKHDDALLKRINSRVKEDDILIILGDFGFCSGEAIRYYREQIKCKTVILILGNHDKHSITYFYRCGFTTVCYEMVLKIGGEFVRLRHHPYRKPWYKCFLPWQYKEKDRNKRPVNHGSWLLHGHTHSRQAHLVQGKQINVGVDLNKFYPISTREIESIISREKAKRNKETLLCSLKKRLFQLWTQFRTKI